MNDNHVVLLCGSKTLDFLNRPNFVDLATGTVTASALLYSSYIGEQKPVDIVADAGSDYLVLMDCRQYLHEEKTPMHYYDTGWDYRFVYALIDKDDYWSGAPNYREISLVA